MARCLSMRYFQAASIRWSAVALRACLVLAAWQGPIPWCHWHGSLAAAADDPWLIEHLQVHHAAPPACDHECLGWHFHCDFRGAVGGDSQPSSGDARHQLPATAAAERCVGPSPGSESVPLAVDAAESEAAGVAYGLPLAGLRQLHFFDAFAPALALPLRLGRLIC